MCEREEGEGWGGERGRAGMEDSLKSLTGIVAYLSGW